MPRPDYYYLWFFHFQYLIVRCCIFKYEGRLEEGRPPGLNQKDRKEPRVAATEDVIGEAREGGEEELQPAERQERRHRLRNHDRKEQVQRETTLPPHQQQRSQGTLSPMQLAVCVRKRPIFKKEEQGGEIDSISCANPQIKVHEPKYKVDGITKYVENHTFTFDNTFNEQEV